MNRSIYCGLQVRARAGSIGTASWNEGRVATVVNVFGNFATYSYGPGEITYRIELRQFWNRFERVETFGPYCNEQPQAFNDVRDAPLGMVLRYDLAGETPAKGANYPYVVRTWSGINGWCRTQRRWVLIPAKHIGPWLHNLKDVWSVPAQWTEAFEYPMPTKAILYVQRIMGAANA